MCNDDLMNWIIFSVRLPYDLQNGPTKTAFTRKRSWLSRWNPKSACLNSKSIALACANLRPKFTKRNLRRRRWVCFSETKIFWRKNLHRLVRKLFGKLSLGYPLVTARGSRLFVSWGMHGRHVALCYFLLCTCKTRSPILFRFLSQRSCAGRSGGFSKALLCAWLDDVTCSIVHYCAFQSAFFLAPKSIGMFSKFVPRSHIANLQLQILRHLLTRHRHRQQRALWEILMQMEWQCDKSGTQSSPIDDVTWRTMFYAFVTASE